MNSLPRTGTVDSGSAPGISSVSIGAELAGLYDRAFMLLMLPLNQINVPANTVALPTLSKLQHDAERFERFLLHGQTVLLHVLLHARQWAIDPRANAFI